jgi:23S rRNA G2445 N2-methylase RlmL
MPAQRGGKKRQPAATTYQCEAEVAPGLEEIAQQEIAFRLGERASFPRKWMPAPGAISFQFTGGLRAMRHLHTVQAVYTVRHFAVPRPRALLGDQNFRKLMTHISFVTDAMPGQFQSVAIQAAGAGSSDMQRIKAAVADKLGIEAADDGGDLVLRLRRPLKRDEGWDVLVRTTPRPLATRGWRVANMEGALNAPVAHAMNLLSVPTPYDVYLNVMCGSGSLLIERLACGPAKQVIGCDTSQAALDCAIENIAASGYENEIELHDWDARELPLPAASIDAITADLPFGQLTGSHEENVTLYPAVLREAGRVLKPSHPFILITHEVRLIEQVLAEMTDTWHAVKVIGVNLRGLHPRIYALQRR